MEKEPWPIISWELGTMSTIAKRMTNQKKKSQPCLQFHIKNITVNKNNYYCPPTFWDDDFISSYFLMKAAILQQNLKIQSSRKWFHEFSSIVQHIFKLILLYFKSSVIRMGQSFELSSLNPVLLGAPGALKLQSSPTKVNEFHGRWLRGCALHCGRVNPESDFTNFFSKFLLKICWKNSWNHFLLD